MKKIQIIILFLILSINHIYAKKDYIPYVGTEAWSGLEISYDVNNWLSFDYENEGRFELDYEKKTRLLNTFSIGYRPLDFLKVETMVRVRHVNRIPSMEYMLQGSTKYSIFDFFFKYRLRFQYKMKDYERILRNKFELGYKISDEISFSLNSESFFTLNSIDFSEFNQMRHSAMVNYDLTSNIEINGGFIYETEFNVKKPKDARIYTLGISLSF